MVRCLLLESKLSNIPILNTLPKQHIKMLNGLKPNFKLECILLGYVKSSSAYFVNFPKTQQFVVNTCESCDSMAHTYSK